MADKMDENTGIDVGSAKTEDKYIAAMVLSGVGDSLGFKNGHWEFCTKGTEIHRELQHLGGIKKIKVTLPQWTVSDDTVMHIATAEALVAHGHSDDRQELIIKLAKEYKNCMSDMEGREPGKTCMKSCTMLDPWSPNGCMIPFNPQGGGCGAAVRAMCIGLRYPRVEQLGDLIAVSIESGRLTHHHPTGYLGALASALFTSYAIQGKHLYEWGTGLVETLTRAKNYITDTGIEKESNINAWGYFEQRWIEYLRQRNITNKTCEPVFPPKDDNPQKEILKRDQFYTYLSYDNWGGSSGHDAPMIAYDALLGCNGSWEELCNRAMFHGGDSDSTGVIAGCLYGAMYGFESVPEKNEKMVEYRDKLCKLGSKLYQLSITTGGKCTPLANGALESAKDTTKKSTEPSVQTTV